MNFLILYKMLYNHKCLKKHYNRKKSGWLWHIGIYVYITHMHTWIRKRREV